MSVPVIALAAMLTAGEAHAQSSPWSVSFDLGAQVALSGDVHGAGTGTVLGLPTQVQARSYGDVYGNGFSWAAGLGYRVGDTGEFRVHGSYTANPADRLQVGTVAGLPLFALFDDYKAFGMDVGYRQYFGKGMVRPDVGACVARLVDDTGARLKVRFAPAALSFLPFVWGDYWIIGLAPDYSWAVVGSPDRDYLWVLSRTRMLAEEEFARAVGAARDNGFPVNRLLQTAQTGAVTSRVSR